MSELKHKMTDLPDCFNFFIENTEGYVLPELFTFPFNYRPHPLSLLATKELQEYIQAQTNWTHPFGFNNEPDAMGKMFGVLVVQNDSGQLGYLAAFSGKLAGTNHHARFVPPVFDILEKDGFFKKGEEEINKVNRQVEALENDEHFIQLQKELDFALKQSEIEIKNCKKDLKTAKELRDERRKQGKQTLSEEAYDALENILNQESADNHYRLKDLNRRWKRRIAELQTKVDACLAPINALREQRKRMSAELQKQLFDRYTFLNKRGELKSLNDIFFTDGDTTLPPSGAGECAAPKLLHYAFKHGLEPVAMAEFWWGQTPSSEIRKHGQFYPACKSKCEPILAHMLAGIPMDSNPMLRNPAEGKELAIVYEDDYVLVVNKPADFLSVPGKKIEDSVFSRVKALYPEALGPLIVHRLDMSTSGLLMIAKTKDVHQNLQSQFLKRKVKKRYAALLEGVLNQQRGVIDLPLRVDLDDRPRQLVCYEYGKPAQTVWEVVDVKNNRTKVHFYPITGRTHQLRVHASHHLGLNTPIVGDDLYGQRAERLYLHAEYLEFMHPVLNKKIQVEVLAEF